MKQTPKQSDTTFREINEPIWKHVLERDWQDNPARGLAISIALEAAERKQAWIDAKVTYKKEGL